MPQFAQSPHPETTLPCRVEVPKLPLPVILQGLCPSSAPCGQSLSPCTTSLSSDGSQPTATSSSIGRECDSVFNDASHQPQQSPPKQAKQTAHGAVAVAISGSVPTPLRVRRVNSDNAAATVPRAGAAVAPPETAVATGPLATGPLTFLEGAAPKADAASCTQLGAQSGVDSSGAAHTVGTAPPPWAPGSKLASQPPTPGVAASHGTGTCSGPKERGNRRYCLGRFWDYPLSNQEKRERIRLLYEQDVQNARFEERRLEEEVSQWRHRAQTINEEKQKLEARIQRQADENLHPVQQMAVNDAHQRELSALAALKVLEHFIDTGAMGQHADVPGVGTMRMIGQLTSQVQGLEHRLGTVVDRLDRAVPTVAHSARATRVVGVVPALRSARGEAVPASARQSRSAGVSTRVSAVARSRPRHQSSVSCCLAGLWRSRNAR